MCKAAFAGMDLYFYFFFIVDFFPVGCEDTTHGSLPGCVSSQIPYVSGIDY